MKFALIGAAALVAAASATPALAQAVISNPVIARSSTRTQIAKTWDLAIRTPMAAIIEMIGIMAMHPSSTTGNVTMRCTTTKVPAFSDRT